MKADEYAEALNDIADVLSLPTGSTSADIVAACRQWANDFTRCNGVGILFENDGWDWREGCETCLRRTALRGERVSMMEPPASIAFECEFLIPPNAIGEARADNATQPKPPTH